eukprot:4622247-Pyramimonas_sp.AAC.1
MDAIVAAIGPGRDQVGVARGNARLHSDGKAIVDKAISSMAFAEESDEIEARFTLWGAGANEMDGRRVRLDNNNRVVFVVAHATPVVKLRNSSEVRAITVDVPAPMAKAAGAGGADVPEWCLVVHRTGSDGMRCVVCKLADERGVASPCKDKSADDVSCK